MSEQPAVLDMAIKEGMTSGGAVSSIRRHLAKGSGGGAAGADPGSPKHTSRLKPGDHYRTLLNFARRSHAQVCYLTDRLTTEALKGIRSGHDAPALIEKLSEVEKTILVLKGKLFGGRAGGSLSKSEIDKALYGRRASKYNIGSKADRTEDGIVFDSVHERDCYLLLKTLESRREITELQLQKRFSLDTVARDGDGSPAHVSSYVADFVYRDRAGQIHIVDAKGYKTAMYRVKKKWFEIQYAPLRIEEI